MKIIITSTGNNLQSKFDLRFGRSAWFCVYDTTTQTTLFIENKNKNVNGGAGTMTAEKAADLGVEMVISGDFGPKAKSLLERFEIQMVILEGKNKSVQEIIETMNN